MKVDFQRNKDHELDKKKQNIQCNRKREAKMYFCFSFSIKLKKLLTIRDCTFKN